MNQFFYYLVLIFLIIEGNFITKAEALKASGQHYTSHLQISGQYEA